MEVGGEGSSLHRLHSADMGWSRGNGDFRSLETSVPSWEGNLCRLQQGWGTGPGQCTVPLVSFPRAMHVQMGKGKLRPTPLPAVPALSWVEQGDMG